MHGNWPAALDHYLLAVEADASDGAAVRSFASAAPRLRRIDFYPRATSLLAPAVKAAPGDREARVLAGRPLAGRVAVMVIALCVAGSALLRALGLGRLRRAPLAA